MNKQFLHNFLLKTIIHIGEIFSLIWLFFAVKNGYLGQEPVDPIIHFTGKAALNNLFLCLIITPLAQRAKLPMLFRSRRLIGLYCFFWAVLHLTSYTWFDLQLDFSLLTQELLKRPYLVIGFISWCILLALSLTSTKKMQKKLGPKWQILHYWVYMVALLIPLHYLWSVKSIRPEPLLYLLFAFILLALRGKKVTRFIKILLPLKK